MQQSRVQLNLWLSHTRPQQLFFSQQKTQHRTMSLALISCFSVNWRLSSKYLVSISYVSCSHCCRSPNGICWRISSWRSASHRACRTYTRTRHVVLTLTQAMLYLHSHWVRCTYIHTGVSYLHSHRARCIDTHTSHVVPTLTLGTLYLHSHTPCCTYIHTGHDVPTLTQGTLYLHSHQPCCT